MYYINDKVKNKFNNDDYFDGKEYVEKIKDAVKTDDIKSIGIYGKWGIGKTSIIKNAISELIEEGEYKENQIVEYNAWKYNEYDFMRDFLIVCSNKIEGKNIAKEREESYYSDSSEDRQLYVMLWKKFLTFLEKSWKVLLFILIAYIFSVIIILQVNKVHPTWYDCADLLTPLTLTIISFILPLFLVSEITHKSVSKKFSPEQFARDFEDIVKDKKILIFIDDIDRCNYQEIKSTFDTLKTFILDENYNVKFIIPVDPNVILNSLDDQTYDYFSKIIDYSIEIKNYTKVKFEPLKEEIISNVKEEYKNIVNDGLYLASKFYIDTPRQMKKFANEFVNEIYNYSSDEIYDKGYMFAKLIILKNEFPNYYHSLIRDYNTILEVTKNEIVKYQSIDYTDYTKNIKGIVFSARLLDFLSKTDNVDLYNFPMYENKISYAEYKIKAICEDPIHKNKFDDNIKIDLKKNYNYLTYEFTENIIKPLLNNKFLYGDSMRRICFLIVEFKKQLNNNSFDMYFEQIVDNYELLEDDRNLSVKEQINEQEVSYLNVKYITECLIDYIEYLNEQKANLLDDKFINKSLELINKNLNSDYKYIENDLLELVQKFNKSKNINNSCFIEIIRKFLASDFKKYHKEFSWYFEFSPKNGGICYVKDIIKLLKDNEELEEKIILKYLNNRYETINTEIYFNELSNNINEILSEPLKYKIIVEPLIINLKGKDVSFEKFEGFLNNTKLISSNELINKLILKVIEEMKTSSDFDREKYNNILTNIGIEYKNSTPIRHELRDLIKKCDIDEQKLIFGYSEENNSFSNFNLLKEYGDVFEQKDDELFEIISNSYCNEEGYVIKSDLERHGFNLKDHKQKIKYLLDRNLNQTIYLADLFTKEEIRNINLNDIEIEELDFENIGNKELLSKIINQIKVILDECIKTIKANKDDKEKIKEQVNRFLTHADILYCKMKYNDQTLWTKLKIIDKYLALNELIESYYIPKLKEYSNLIGLFSNGKYKDNYLKNNICADKIIAGIK